MGGFWSETKRTEGSFLLSVLEEAEVSLLLYVLKELEREGRKKKEEESE